MKDTSLTLPSILPVLPLSGVLLLPHGYLPLNIFETNDIQMLDDAMQNHKMIGIVQPVRASQKRNFDLQQPTELFPLGCAGRVVDMKVSTSRLRYLILLEGVSRFRIEEELKTQKNYRQVKTSWEEFSADPHKLGEQKVNRENLLSSFKKLLELKKISVEWNDVSNISNYDLVTSLAMMHPFAPVEQQALLEATDVGERSRKLNSLLQMSYEQASAMLQ